MLNKKLSPNACQKFIGNAITVAGTKQLFHKIWTGHARTIATRDIKTNAAINLPIPFANSFIFLIIIYICFFFF